MINSCAYLLVIHGSRNSSYQKNVNNLESLVKNNLDNQGLNYILNIAYLELGEQSLSEQIVDFAKLCQEKKYNKLKILPLFLLAGTHVKEDIPQQINQAIKNIKANKINIKIEIKQYLGSHHKFIDLISKKYPKNQDDKIVMIAHGTTLQNGNQELNFLTHKLGYELAFWSIYPSLTEKINVLIRQGYQNIFILPYFLFTGKITITIAEQIAQLQKQYRHINFVLLETIAEKKQFAEVIIQILLES